MQSKTLKILNAINWLVIGLIVFLYLVFGFSEETGGGALAGLATVIALTGIIWAPIVFVVAVSAFLMEVQVIKKEQFTWTRLLRKPSTYVLAASLFVLSMMF